MYHSTTNPFTKIEDLKNACELYEKSPSGAFVSVTKLPLKKENFL